MIPRREAQTGEDPCRVGLEPPPAELLEPGVDLAVARQRGLVVAEPGLERPQLALEPSQLAGALERRLEDRPLAAVPDLLSQERDPLVARSADLPGGGCGGGA